MSALPQSIAIDDEVFAPTTMPFLSAPPKVSLVNTFQEPFNNAIATARTCYSARVITPFDVAKDAKAQAQRDAIAESVYDAGHHTTLQHATFQFVLENVSRQFVWSFLHAHPFYNSEQVSQRYVAVKPERVLVPKFDRATKQKLYDDTIAQQMRCYQQLSQLLLQPVTKEYFRLFPGRHKDAEKHTSALRKKAQEVARYALPVATFAHLYHTVSGLTLHRYHRLCAMLDVPQETKRVVGAMVQAVAAVDPLFFRAMEDPLALEETHEYQTLVSLGRLQVSTGAKQFCREFDHELGGLSSKLIAYQNNAETILARSVRHVLGVTADVLSDSQAIALVLSPTQNPYLGGALNLTSMGKMTRALAHPHYTFQKKISHTADSQDQRHRMTPASRPLLHTHFAAGDVDVIVPALIQHHAEAQDMFMTTMQNTWEAIESLLHDGVAPEQALYLLPNAFPIRFVESGDLSALRHKWVTRLCYNAQEEIWQASLEEVRQVQEVHPQFGPYLGPPCHQRQQAKARPLCPEGERYCGVPVWKLSLENFSRVL